MEPISKRCKSFIYAKLRLAWRYYSAYRKECLRTSKCVDCKKLIPIKERRADHIEPIGTFTPEDIVYVKRLFCDRSNYAMRCRMCHGLKTRAERKKKL